MGNNLGNKRVTKNTVTANHNRRDPDVSLYMEWGFLRYPFKSVRLCFLKSLLRYQTALHPDRSFLGFFNFCVKSKVGKHGKKRIKAEQKSRFFLRYLFCSIGCHYKKVGSQSGPPTFCFLAKSWFQLGHGTLIPLEWFLFGCESNYRTLQMLHLVLLCF